VARFYDSTPSLLWRWKTRLDDVSWLRGSGREIESHQSGREIESHQSGREIESHQSGREIESHHSGPEMEELGPVLA
jgi:hypothetical protein